MIFKFPVLPCCNHGPNEECKQICRSTLSSKNMTTEEIIDNLEPVCGIPLPTAPFWQCFLNGGNKVNNNDNVKEVSRINEVCDFFFIIYKIDSKII